MVAVAEAGASVEVPACVAVIEQFPLLSKVKTDPTTEQTPVDEVSYVITPPLDADADKARFFNESSAVVGGLKEIVCDDLETSKTNLYRSDSRYVSVIEL